MSITVGCPKCRSLHQLEVWGEGTQAQVDELVDCSCGVSFSVLIVCAATTPDIEEEEALIEELQRLSQ